MILMNHQKETKLVLKSDPLQGILFKVDPVNLRNQAMKRSNRKIGQHLNFFQKLPELKMVKSRLNRHNKLISDVTSQSNDSADVYRRLKIDIK